MAACLSSDCAERLSLLCFFAHRFKSNRVLNKPLLFVFFRMGTFDSVQAALVAASEIVTPVSVVEETSRRCAPFLHPTLLNCTLSLTQKACCSNTHPIESRVEGRRCQLRVDCPRTEESFALQLRARIALPHCTAAGAHPRLRCARRRQTTLVLPYRGRCCNCPCGARRFPRYLHDRRVSSWPPTSRSRVCRHHARRYAAKTISKRVRRCKTLAIAQRGPTCVAEIRRRRRRNESSRACNQAYERGTT